MVKKKDSGKVFAMKVLRKGGILEANALVSTLLEKDILLDSGHPFLMSMNYVFQNEGDIFFVMRLARGE